MLKRWLKFLILLLCLNFFCIKSFCVEENLSFDFNCNINNEQASSAIINYVKMSENTDLYSKKQEYLLNAISVCEKLETNKEVGKTISTLFMMLGRNAYKNQDYKYAEEVFFVSYNMLKNLDINNDNIIAFFDLRSLYDIGRKQVSSKLQDFAILEIEKTQMNLLNRKEIKKNTMFADTYLYLAKYYEQENNYEKRNKYYKEYLKVGQALPDREQREK